MLESQRQAYLNEFKGNLFEYLVGRNLARCANLERNFLESIPLEAQKFLAHYEKELRILEPKLPVQLTDLADIFCNRICEDSKLSFDLIENIFLVGKVKEGLLDYSLGEADLLLSYEDKIIPLSLKLVKHQSFVNTKSAGVRTFFEKYFDDSEVQEDVNREVDIAYEAMARSLHQNHDFDYVGNFSQWVSEGLPELPGKLEDRDKKILHKSYQDISKIFYKQLKKFSSSQKFQTQLSPLLGKSDSSMIQLLCFHKGTETYEFVDYHIDLPSEDDNFDLEAEEPHHASIHLSGENKVFQLRIKPMNKFTVPSFKVNCSVKYL